MKDEEAVSPVIGVILMVAITVILAAVIAAFVFGMAGTVKKTYNVGASATRQGAVVTVMYNGGADADQVASLAYTGQLGGAASCAVTPSGAWTPTAPAVPNVGTYCLFTQTTTGKVHAILVATFKDQSSNVVLDSYV